MSALRPTSPRPATNQPPAPQDGVVLLVALIILVALTLAGVALIRSVDTGNIIAGNLSFRESAVHSGERGTQTAVLWLEGISNNVDKDKRIWLHDTSTDRPYYAAVHVDRAANETWDAYWTRLNTAPAAAADGGVDPAGNSVRYFIHRLCEIKGAPHLANCTKQPPSTDVGNSYSPTPGGGAIASSQVYYRITTRITGPRNTVAYIQTIIAL